MKTSKQNIGGGRRVVPAHQAGEPADDALVDEQAKKSSSADWQIPEPILIGGMSGEVARRDWKLPEEEKQTDRAKIISDLLQSLRLELAIISLELSVRVTPPFKPLFVVAMSNMHKRLVQAVRDIVLTKRISNDHGRLIGDATACYELVHHVIHNADTQKTRPAVSALEIAGRRFEKYLSKVDTSVVNVSLFPPGPADADSLRRALEETGPNRKFPEPFINIDIWSDGTYTDEVSLSDDIQRLVNSAHIPVDAREAFALSIRRLISEARRPVVSGVPNPEIPAQLEHKEALLPFPKKKDVIRYDQRHKHDKLRDLGIIEFLKAVWGPWMESRSLTRAALRKVDPSADQAIQNWLRKSPDRQLPPDIHLPKQREVYDEVLARDPSAPLKSPKIASALGMRLRRQAPKS